VSENSRRRVVAGVQALGILHEIIRIVMNMLRGCVVLRHCIRVRGGDGS
jgi:hypothetical protein